jgi:hypothetical protein
MRLVVIERGAEGADRTVELVHESLIDRWPTLARWLAENRDDAVFLARLRSAAQAWEKHARNEGLLWREALAQEARLWYAHYRGVLAKREQDYLHAVLTLDTRTTRRRRQLVAGTVLVVLLMTFGLTWNAQEGMRGELLRHLSGAVSLKRDSMDRWYEERRWQALRIPRIPGFEATAAALAATPFDSRHTHPAYTAIREHLQFYTDRDSFYDEVFLMATDGRIILSTDPLQEGDFKDIREYFRGARN